MRDEADALSSGQVEIGDISHPDAGTAVPVADSSLCLQVDAAASRLEVDFLGHLSEVEVPVTCVSKNTASSNGGTVGAGRRCLTGRLSDCSILPEYLQTLASPTSRYQIGKWHGYRLR